MSDIKNSLFEISKKSENCTKLSTYISNKGNAKLGDALVNFIYSLAKSIAIGTPTGVKVSDSILTEAYRESSWRKSNILTLKGNKGHIADGVEALILYFWVHGNLTLDDLVSPIKDELNAEKLHHPREEYRTAINSFTNLLNSLLSIYKTNILTFEE